MEARRQVQGSDNARIKTVELILPEIKADVAAKLIRKRKKVTETERDKVIKKREKKSRTKPPSEERNKEERSGPNWALGVKKKESKGSAQKNPRKRERGQQYLELRVTPMRT